MKKVRDLTGYELDFWVGVARGGLPRVVRDDPDFPAGVCRLDFTVEQDIYRPSEGDHFGKSIIKAEKIQISKPPFAEHWVASMPAKGEQQINAAGDTEYQAAMRAYVISQLGEEVEEDIDDYAGRRRALLEQIQSTRRGTGRKVRVVVIIIALLLGCGLGEKFYPSLIWGVAALAGVIIITVVDTRGRRKERARRPPP
jgi:hypothetical protein